MHLINIYEKPSATSLKRIAYSRINHEMDSYAAYARVPTKSSTTYSHSSISDNKVSGNQPISSTSTWKIGWRTPALIIGSYLLGMILSTNLLCQYSHTNYSHHCCIWQLWLFQVPQWEIRRWSRSNYAPIICLDLFQCTSHTISNSAPVLLGYLLRSISLVFVKDLYFQSF